MSNNNLLKELINYYGKILLSFSFLIVGLFLCTDIDLPYASEVKRRIDKSCIAFILLLNIIIISRYLYKFLKENNKIP
jgi:hypothetical protein